MTAPFFERVEPDLNSGCWLWGGYIGRHGYGACYHEGREQLAHRVSWSLAMGRDPGPLHILHKCDTPTCVNPQHLFAGTRKDNMQDKVRKGRAYTGHHAGEANAAAKLRADDIPEIKRLLASGLLQREVAAAYGVSRGAIQLIGAGKRWVA